MQSIDRDVCHTRRDRNPCAAGLILLPVLSWSRWARVSLGWTFLSAILPADATAVFGDLPASLASFCRVVLNVLRLRMQVVSGIAVSLDGKSSWYIPLPSLLPPRPCEWHQLAHPPDEAPDGSPAAGRANSGLGASPQNAGGGDAPAGEGHGRSGAEKEPTRRPSSWGALPAEAIERVSILVSAANYGAVFVRFLPFKQNRDDGCRHFRLNYRAKEVRKSPCLES